MPKQTPLVSQFLENINRDALERYQAIIKSYVRKRQGIYALYRRDRLYYVGLATELRSRLKAHLGDRHGESWDRFSVYLTVGDQHLRDLESLVLRIVKPKGNKVIGRFKKSENIRRRFAKDIRLRLRAEYDDIFGRIRVLETDINRNGDKRLAKIFGRKSRTRTIRGVYKRKLYRARLHPNGTVRFNRQKFSSLSAAAIAIVQRPCSGWSFWKVERAPGDWVRMSQLR
jgi:hypothetical protein